MERSERSTFAIGLGEITGAAADLGVFVPLVTALILVNGLDAGSTLLAAGALVVATGLFFKVPFPVQPLKALAAVAVAEKLTPGVIHAAGLEIAVFLMLLSVKGVADRVARLFTKVVVRSLQLGVGVLLVITAAKLIAEPPAVFRGTPAPPWPLVLAGCAFALVAWGSAKERYGFALLMLLGGVAGVMLTINPALGPPTLLLPSLSFPPLAAYGSAFFLLVIPQLPLTFGNAVVAVTDLEHEYFGERARHVTASRVCTSCAIGNVVAAIIGGMPMCHGAGGLTAHVRLGARSAGMNVVLGAGMIGLGLFFAPQIPSILGLLPVWVLAGFLAYAGLRHAWLVTDLRGMPLIIAVTAGCAGAYLGNLAVTAAIAVVAAHSHALARRS